MLQANFSIFISFVFFWPAGHHGFGATREINRASYIHREDMDTGQNEALERDVVGIGITENILSSGFKLFEDRNIVFTFTHGNGKSYTVKPAVAATSIKRDPPISGHFRGPLTILNANAPLLSVHLSNVASGQRNSPQKAESVSLNGHLLAASLIKFHRF